MNLLTDIEIIQKVKHGQTEQFELLVRRYQARMRAFASHYIFNRDDVYDLIQDVFIEAFLNIDSFDENYDFLPWLRAICRHRVLNYFRSTKVRYKAIQTLIAEVFEDKAADDVRCYDNSLERIDALKSCIGKLKRDNQELIHKRYYTKVSVKEIASQLDQTAASVSMLLHRIRLVLQRCIQRELSRENCI